MSEPRLLQCMLASGDPPAASNSQTIHLHQEEGKKSSFLLEGEEKSSVMLSKPAHIIVDNLPEERRKDWQPSLFFGGFVIRCNARHVEVYMTEKNGKEEYLMTSKGIPIDAEKIMHKAVCAVPGGAREVVRVHLKLLSLKPNGTDDAHVEYLKVTARLPDPPGSEDAVASPKNSAVRLDSPATPATSLLARGTQDSVPPTSPLAHAPLNSPPIPTASSQIGDSASISKEDLGAAMASVSIVARTTEERMERAMESQFRQLQSVLLTSTAQLVKPLHEKIGMLTDVSQNQAKLLELQRDSINEQQSKLDEQQKLIASIISRQDELKASLEKLDSQTSDILQGQEKNERAMHSIREEQASSRAQLEGISEAISKFTESSSEFFMSPGRSLIMPADAPNLLDESLITIQESATEGDLLGLSPGNASALIVDDSFPATTVEHEEASDQPVG